MTHTTPSPHPPQEPSHDEPTFDVLRETFGRIVRRVWIEWAREQPNPKSSWLVEWEGLSEPDREVDRRIGERLAREGVALRTAELIALERKLAQSEWELAEAVTACRKIFAIVDTSQTCSPGNESIAVLALDVIKDRATPTEVERDGAQQAQRDTAARAGMAEELAGMLTEYREALYDGPENLTGLTNDRLETESAALLARYAALPKGRL